MNLNPDHKQPGTMNLLTEPDQWTSRAMNEKELEQMKLSSMKHQNRNIEETEMTSWNLLEFELKKPWKLGT